MAQFFSGYARERGFKPISLPSVRSRQDEQYVRSVQLARDLDNQNAVKVHKQLQDQFDLDQETRQTYRDLEVQAADLERTAKLQQFKFEIENAEARQKDRIGLLTSLSTVSKTATDILVQEKEKQNKAQLQLNQNLVLRYGLNAQEVRQLQAMEGGLLDFEAQQAPLIQQLRQQGASESDISALMKNSGWNAYGSALGAVQNAAENYDLYLTSKQDEEVVINGVSMSLSGAEATGDVAAIAGIFDRHRMNYLKENLAGYDPAFVAKHARESFQQAESRRKRSMSTRIEEVARKGNRAKEKANLFNAIREDLTNPQSYMDRIEMNAGGWDSPLIGTSHNRSHEQLVELAKDGLAPRSYVEGIFNTTVKAKQFGGREVPFNQAFPLKTKELRDALDEADEDRRRIMINSIEDQKRRGDQMADALILEIANNPNLRTLDNIAAVQDHILAESGNIEAANKVAKLIPFSVEKQNDKEFDSYWGPQKALGIYPTQEQILFGGLSPGKITSELQSRKDFEDAGLTEEVLSNLDKRIESSLRRQLIGEYGSTQAVLPESYYPAFSTAKAQALLDFRTAYKGPGTAFEAENYAIGQLQKELDKKDDGQYKANPAPNPGFTTFMGVSGIKKESSLPAIVDAHKGGVEAFRTELFIDTGRAKRLAKQLNRGKKISIPTEYNHIVEASGGNISDVIFFQHELARKEDPSIPELRPEVKSRFQKAEKVIDPGLLNIIQRYSTPATVDRALVQSNIPAIYDRDQPYVSFGRMIEATGRMRPDLIPMFLAIANEESRFDLNADTSKSGTDPNKEREWSRGAWQINWLAHSDKLTRVGMTPEDLSNPVKNLMAALMVYEERVQLYLKGDPSRNIQPLPLEEAQLRGFEPWSVYTSGKYKYSLPEAERRWKQYKEQSNLPTWQQSSYMNPAAQRWLEQNRNGVWIG